MDADIAAADALTLERIKAQDYRNDVASLVAHREAQRAQFAAFLDWIKAEYAALPDSQAELKQSVALAIATNYMKPTTGTLPETIQLDATNDAARLKAAVDAVSTSLTGA